MSIDKETIDQIILAILLAIDDIDRIKKVQKRINKSVQRNKEVNIF